MHFSSNRILTLAATAILLTHGAASAQTTPPAPVAAALDFPTVLLSLIHISCGWCRIW